MKSTEKRFRFYNPDIGDIAWGVGVRWVAASAIVAGALFGFVWFLTKLPYLFLWWTNYYEVPGN